jgi:NAD(P)-dependent dehydrogenase (short-subunit alcohol dehydrogenase family)
MDFELKGRTAVLVGLDDDLAAACADVLTLEGVTVQGESEAALADNVVASGYGGRFSGSLPDLAAEDLSEAWGSVLRAVSAYRAALPAMVDRGWGRFIWIGTAQAKALDSAGAELDAIVSLGMMGLHKVIAAEEGWHGLTANSVLRGGPATDMDIANAVAFVCSQGAAYVTGVTFSVDGGAGSAVF